MTTKFNLIQKIYPDLKEDPPIWYKRLQCRPPHGYINGVLFVLLAIAGVLGMLAGSIWDLPVDQFLYHPEALWASIFAFIGPLPAFWALGTASLLLLQASKEKHFPWSVSVSISVIALAISIYKCVDLMSKVCSLSTWVMAVISLLAVYLPSWLLFTFLRGKIQPETLVYFAFFLLAVVLLETVLITLIKDVRGRPRYYFLISESKAEFEPWYLFGSVQKETLSALLSPDKDVFRSFPSGHTGSSACILAFCAIPLLTNRKVSLTPVLSASLIWIVLTAISRLVLGMHFISDVSAGFLIGLAAFAICYWFFFSRFKSRHPERTCSCQQ